MSLHYGCDMFPPEPVKGLYAWNGCRVNSSQFITRVCAPDAGKEDNGASSRELIDPSIEHGIRHSQPHPLYVKMRSHPGGESHEYVRMERPASSRFRLPQVTPPRCW
jgi:hypothetical protein